MEGYTTLGRAKTATRSCTVRDLSPAAGKVLGGYVADDDPLTSDFADADRDISSANRPVVRGPNTVAMVAGLSRSTYAGAPLTVIEGMCFENGGEYDGTTWRVLATIGCSNAVVLRSNTVLASTVDAVGILLLESWFPGPVVVDNDILATGQNSTGLEIRGGTNAVGSNRVTVELPGNDGSGTGVSIFSARATLVQDLSIEVRGTPGVAYQTLTGLYVADTGYSAITGCRIHLHNGQSAHGVILDGQSTSVLLDGNAVYVSGRAYSHAFSARAVPAAAFSNNTVVNNVFWARIGEDPGTANPLGGGATFSNASGVIFANNTVAVDVVTSAEETFENSAVLTLTDDAHPIVHNNILAATGERRLVGVDVRGSDVGHGAYPRSLQSNAFVGVSDPYRLLGTPESAPNPFPGLPVCYPEFAALCDGQTTFTTVQNDGNFQVAAELSELTAAPAGIAADLALTLATNDWHLTGGADGAGVSTGGRDTALATCGYLEEPTSCGCSRSTGELGGYSCITEGLTFDHAGAARTDPLSVGAFERD